MSDKRGKSLSLRKTPVLQDWYLRSRLKLRQVLLLVALDEHRSMHRAASHVAMTQPAATRMLGELERALNVQLFERGPHGVVPNAYGESLIRHSRMMLSALDHARDEINAISMGATGRTYVGALQVATPTLVPQSIMRFKARHPNHTIHLREDKTTTVLLPALWRGELDLVVGVVSGDVEREGLRFEPLSDEPMRVVSRVGHPLTRRRTIKFSVLANEPWILPAPDSVYRERLDDAFRQAGGEPPKVVVESMSILMNMLLLQRTDMLAVMPSRLAMRYAALGELSILPAKPPTLSGPIGVITLVGRPLSLAGSEFVQSLREAAAERS